MHYARIAQTLGRPLGTVKSQMRLALVKMRRALQDIAKGKRPRQGERLRERAQRILERRGTYGRRAQNGKSLH